MGAAGVCLGRPRRCSFALCAEIFHVVWLAKTVQDKPSPRRGSLELLGEFSLELCGGCKLASLQFVCILFFALLG